ncbi:MAG: cysteine--tRNA ligase [Ignavibacteriales bacterium UTCHB2]|jgi:cysteinyl-tRNA synthetase|nr:MAG: Cysteine--tRNA ligase [Ignavibacteria bacterium ADurb.Bin266]OQY73879.1 MAG: cysteine--tRNA ligase [Ignavibacteriales bacterium UTCHB2]HQI41025.1 cysteine--tRNA ligase [Ignavibacteriaceae bacterium]
MLKLYNTLTKKVEEFIPIDPNEVKFYVCGPTVYDYFHIGNARSFIMADMVRRYLEYKGYKVKFVMNLTDVDDKIIKKSLEEKREAKDVSTDYINAFFEDITKLKIKKATVYPKATEHMHEMIDMIKKLVDKNYAYNIDGNVFYDVKRFSEYGKLSGKNTEELEVGARIDANEEKKDPLDFALWKKAKEGEPFWDSPWGKGRPGWHVECSAMSCKHLGETFDIHAGGNDLIFPHHENEIAQSEAANQKPFVKYWLHFGFLNINEEKMSKSLGNFFTARDVLKKYSAEAIRMFFAQAYYRGPLNFSDDLLTAAEKGLEKINNLVDKVNSEIKKNNSGIKPEFEFNSYYKKFEEAMDDDFNTSQAVAVIFDFVKDVNRVVAPLDNVDVSFYNDVKTFLTKTAENVLGIVDFNKTTTGDDKLTNDLIELLIRLRTEAKQNKNYQLSDSIRDRLKELGVILQDSKEGTTYKIGK